MRSGHDKHQSSFKETARKTEEQKRQTKNRTKRKSDTASNSIFIGLHHLLNISESCEKDPMETSNAFFLT
jgi:hypothetical protein